MTEEKARRIQAAITSTAVILLFILVSIMVYQMGVIKGKKAKIEQLQTEIRVLEEQKEQTQDSIDLWLCEWKITERANELGYLYENDK
ncbi:MAG: hypothetical protein IKJ19_07425 [Clostridia bacterium]|nr:hypothetical protein [Clostridia bacterium]